MTTGRREIRWLLAFVLVGVAARTFRWFLGFPFWGDESNLALNLLDRGFADLLRPLDHAQVAPVGFVAGEIALYRAFGPGEQALRALPWLSSIASLACFVGLARSVQRLCPTLPRIGTLLGVAIFAVSHYLIRYGSELKPYSCDLLAASLLLWLAAAWIEASERGTRHADRWLWAIAFVAVPLLVMSYAAILVVAAVALALAPRVWRLRDTGARQAYVAYGIASAVGLFVSYAVVGRAQRTGANLGTEYLEKFWEKAFPPGDPGALLGWLLDTHTGLMFAYPNGGRHGGSTATLLFFLVGLWALLRRRVPADERPLRREIAWLLLAPFAFGLLAASVRLYPYGGHLRLVLYLAPAICLLAGIGLATALDAFHLPERRVLATRIALVALLLAGVGAMAGDALQPFRNERHAGMRDAIAEAASRLGPRDALVSLHTLAEIRSSDGLGSNFEWYLRTSTPAPVAFAGTLDDGAALRGHGRAHLVAYAPGAGEQDPAALTAWLARHDAFLARAERHVRCLQSECRDALVVSELTTPAAAATTHVSDERDVPKAHGARREIDAARAAQSVDTAHAARVPVTSP